MKTSANRDLFAYWNNTRGNRIAPERSDIEPDAIRHVLGDSFFLASGSNGDYPFRLAGTRVCALFGRELKSDLFSNLWGSADQTVIRKLLSVIVEEKIGVVAQATGRTTNGSPLVVNLELLILPLMQRSTLDARAIGALVPVNVPFWLGARFVGTLELGALRHIGPSIEQVSAPRLIPALPTQTTSTLAAASNASSPLSAKNPSTRHAGQNRSRFVVYEGGRTD